MLVYESLHYILGQDYFYSTHPFVYQDDGLSRNQKHAEMSWSVGMTMQRMATSNVLTGMQSTKHTILMASQSVLFLLTKPYITGFSNTYICHSTEKKIFQPSESPRFSQYRLHNH